MSIPSVLRLRQHVIREQRSALRSDVRVRLQVKQPFRAAVTLREKGSDFDTFAEVVEQEIYRPVIGHAGSVGTILDLGANVGLASLYFASHYAGASILSVEPHPGTYELLAKNTKPYKKIRALEGAVWSKSCALEAVGDPNDRYSGFRVSESALGKIEGFTLPELMEMAGFNSIDLLKVDIEGAEAQLFREPSWLKKVRVMAVEFHGDSREVSDFDAIVRSNGFRVVEGGHTTIAFRAERG